MPNRQWIWIVAVAFVCYGLSVFNDYALDDFIVIVKNKFTQQGFSGIGNILSHDTFAGMTDAEVNGLVGARYRPLSVITFAIEQQIFHNSPFISHLINVILYAISGVLLFKWLLLFKTSFSKKNWKQISFAASLLFMALPVHSESVINIKGRDDLLCLLFFLLAAIQLFQYGGLGKSKNLFLSVVFYFLALMSKETAITFLAAFPLALFFFSDSTKQKIISSSCWFAAVAGLFLLFRFLATKENNGAINEDILNNPFIHASAVQKYATVFLTWLMYLKLLVFPYHLSYDYNYNQIPLTDFSNPQVILSILIQLPLLIMAIYFFRKKPVYSFSIFFYFLTFSIVSNFFLTTGTPLAERFVLIPSIGFCIAIPALLVTGFEKLKNRNQFDFLSRLKIIMLFAVLSVFSVRNISRCLDWKNNNTLFLSDVDETPNSAKSQLNAGFTCLNLAKENSGDEKEKLLDESMSYLQKGIVIYPEKIDGYINMGVAYNWKNDYKNAELWWNKARAVNPLSPQLNDPDRVLSVYYLHEGMKYGVDKKYELSIRTMLHALQYDSLNAEILFNLGGAYFTIQNADSAIYYFQKTLLKNPDYPNASNGLQSAMHLQEIKKAR